MKKLLLSLTLLLSALSWAQAAKTIRVKSTADFLHALGSNRTIIIEKNCVLNLSGVLENEEFSDFIGLDSDFDPYAEYRNGKPINYKEYRKGAPVIIGRTNEFDGFSLWIVNAQNLTIKGESGAELIIEPRYANVLGFLGCRNITLENLTLGHTPQGSCHGQVLYFEGVNDIKIKNCDLYGCGTYGIEARGCNNLECTGSIIRDCSYGIMVLHGVSNFTFHTCDFYRNRDYTMLEINNSRAVSFINSRFTQNRGDFISGNTQVLFKGCRVYGIGDYRNIFEQITDENCTWSPQDEEVIYNPNIGPR